MDPKNLTSKQRIFCVCIGLIFIFVFWESCLRLNIVSDILLPYPKDVLTELIKLLTSTQFWKDISSTIFTWLLGVILGTLIGGSLGLIVGLNKFVWAAIEPWVEFFRSLPSVVLVPFISIFLGVGMSSRLACSTLVVLLLMILFATE